MSFKWYTLKLISVIPTSWITCDRRWSFRSSHYDFIYILCPIKLRNIKYNVNSKVLFIKHNKDFCPNIYGYRISTLEKEIRERRGDEVGLADTILGHLSNLLYINDISPKGGLRGKINRPWKKIIYFTLSGRNSNRQLAAR